MAISEQKMDYKSTLNLPRTDFPMKANLSVREPEILKSWQEKSLYNKMLERRKDSPKFIFHDGPPYANGEIHLGTALNKVLKDIIVRYKTMRGYRVDFVPGFDCHGLPTEHKILSELGPEAKKKSPTEIIELCRESAQKWVTIMSEQFQRLGVLGTWDTPYLTMNKDYEAAILGVLKDLVENGLVYQGLMPVHWCASCGTALAEAEVEYEDHTSPSIYVRFPVINRQEKDFLKQFDNLTIIIWTTTPWTLPANLAVCLHPEFDYVAVKVKNEVWIVAEGLIENVKKECDLDNVELLGKWKGKELEGLTCAHPLMDKESIVLLSDYVTLEQGTGCVHTAPGHGMEDYLTALKYDLPIFVPVDDEGKFNDNYPDMKGVSVWDANEPILTMLKEKGLLIKSGEVSHSYPHCWRCHNPVIFRATEQWFMSMSEKDIRTRALKTIDEVTWIPGWGRNRIYSMVENRPDWCLSRQKCWGVPIPALSCKSCQKTILDPAVIEITIEKVRKKSLSVWSEEDATAFLPEGFKCPSCSGTDFEKQRDILDVWFDAGSSHIAVLETRENLSSPADLYLEGSDQHRGWFQTSLLVAIGARDRAPYKSVLTHGFLLDEKGEAMSKSKGNVISPIDVVNQLGADVLRMWVTSEDYRNDVSASDKLFLNTSDTYRRVRNTFKFILGNLHGFDLERDGVALDDMEEIDRWALSRLAGLVNMALKAYDNFEFHKVYHQSHAFCVVDMSSFYLDMLKDRLYTSAQKDKKRYSAQTALYYIFSGLTRILAPIIPFTTDEAWQYFGDSSESIHLTDFPEHYLRFSDQKLEEEWATLLLVREEVSKALEEARRKKIIGHSLDAQVHLKVSQDGLYVILEAHNTMLASIFIVSACSLEKVASLPPLEREKVAPVHVEVIFAKGEKCERCWKYSEQVGIRPEHPTICTNCAEAIRRNDDG